VNGEREHKESVNLADSHPKYVDWHKLFPQPAVHGSRMHFTLIVDTC